MSQCRFRSFLNATFQWTFTSKPSWATATANSFTSSSSPVNCQGDNHQTIKITFNLKYRYKKVERDISYFSIAYHNF